MQYSHKHANASHKPPNVLKMYQCTLCAQECEETPLTSVHTMSSFESSTITANTANICIWVTILNITKFTLKHYCYKNFILLTWALGIGSIVFWTLHWALGIENWTLSTVHWAFISLCALSALHIANAQCAQCALFALQIHLPVFRLCVCQAWSRKGL